MSGNDLMITVRHDLQMRAYELLKDKRGAIVALSPQDGALLTLVSAPSVDANKFISGFEPGEWEKIALDPKKPLLNKAIQPYPPGSTFKIITALAGLEAGIIKVELGCILSVILTTEIISFVVGKGKVMEGLILLKLLLNPAMFIFMRLVQE